MKIAALAVLASLLIVGCENGSSGGEQNAPAGPAPVDQFAIERAMLDQTAIKFDRYAEALKRHRQCLLDSEDDCIPPTF